MCTKCLNDRQRKFIEYYLITGVATEAAKRAGYSPKTAHVQGVRLLHNPTYKHVADEIARRQREMSEKLEITAEDVRRELWEALQVAKASVSPALNSKTGKPIRDEDGNSVYKVNLPAWLKACELLGKLTSVGAFTDNVRISTEEDLIARLHQGRARVAANQKDDE